jgi:hypothetical protein
MAGVRANLVGTERLPPLVEEVAERVNARDRRLDVNDAVGGVGVESVEARSGDNERPARRVLGLCTRNADSSRNLPLLSVHEYGQMRVNVEKGLLAALATDAVDGLAGGCRGQPGQSRRGGNRHPFGTERACRRSRAEFAESMQRRERLPGRSGRGAPGPAGSGERSSSFLAACVFWLPLGTGVRPLSRLVL